MSTNTAIKAHSSTSKHSTRKGDARQHILLADDDAEMRALLSLTLMNEGYNVIECRDGEELSLCIRESCYRNSENVDVIISDIRMPGMSGLGALKIHGSNPRCPPVILMTAFGDQATRDEAMKMGAAAFLEKPFGMDELIKKIRELAPP